MSFAKLSPSEQQTVLQCMKAIANGTEIEDWEFQTRLGLDRASLKRVISSWPMIDDSLEGSDEFLAINNCLNEVCNGIDIPDAQWQIWFAQTKDEIKRTYRNWLGLPGGS